jgi:hypothetical protein
MALEEINEVAHLGLVGRELAGALGHLDEAVPVPRFFHFRKEEVQLDEVDVLNFIGAILDELPGGHEGRHVTAHPHSAGMRAIGDDRDELGFDGGIYFHLDVAMVRVPVDGLDRFFGGIDTRFGGAGQLAGAVNKAGFENARA